MSHSHGYSDLVQRHFLHPSNCGPLTGTHEVTLRGAAGQRAHGTQIVFFVGVDAARIAEMTFQAFGCPHTIAACSVQTERLTGGPIEWLADFRREELAACLDLPIEKAGRLLIIEDALRKCHEAWDNRRLGRDQPPGSLS